MTIVTNMIYDFNFRGNMSADIPESISIYLKFNFRAFKQVVSGVYAIYNFAENKYYIGSSKNVEERIKQHYKQLQKSSHYNKLLQESYNRCGYNNFVFIPLECVKTKPKHLDKALEEAENKWFKLLNPFDDTIGYNIKNIAFRKYTKKVINQKL